MKTFFIVTFGCQMNVHESEKLTGLFLREGFVQADNIDNADIIVFNTCAIRESAQMRAIGNIGALKQVKKKKQDLIIAVSGCITQQKSEAKKIREKYKFVDIIVGTHNFYDIINYIKEKEINNKKTYAVCEIEKPDIVEGVPLIRSSGENAWINISYGCNNFCSYCIVPYVRGRERSREVKNILAEIKDIVACGKYSQITLLGQNVNSYGNDFNDKLWKEKKINFVTLLQEICSLNGDFKIAFMSSHPKDFSDELIQFIKNEPKMLKEIHLPCQSGSNRILKAMNRSYSREDYLKIVRKIKKEIPDVRLTSDFIVGFPGETEEDFNDTLNLMKEVKFDGIFGYMYSKRKGTAAESLPDHIESAVKRKRVNIILNLQKEINKNKLKNN